MDKKETIQEIKRYPHLYFDDVIQALNEKGISEDSLKIWVELALKDLIIDTNKKIRDKSVK